METHPKSSFSCSSNWSVAGLMFEAKSILQEPKVVHMFKGMYMYTEENDLN